MKAGRREGQAISVFMLLAAILVILLAFAQLSGCFSQPAPEPEKSAPGKPAPATKTDEEPEMLVTDTFDEMWNIIEVRARKGHDSAATYYYRLADGASTPTSLNYYNSHGSRVRFEMDRSDNILLVELSGETYDCSKPENESLCKKAAEKVRYWKFVMKWDERVKRILEELKNRKPEDELD